MEAEQQPVNDFDFGVCNDELSIKIVDMMDNKVALKDGEFINPFFVGVASENQLDKLDNKQLYSTYKRVLIMCTRQNYTGNPKAENIYNMVFTHQSLIELAPYFTLLSCPRKLLSSNFQYERALRVEKKYLEMFNHNTLILELDEIVIPFFELKEDMAQLHLSLYDTTLSMPNVSKMMSLNNYYNNDYQGLTQKNLSQMMLNTKESEYWTNSYNCNITMNDQFSQRSFEWRKVKPTNEMTQNKTNIDGDNDVTKIINKLATDNYQLNAVYKPESYVDISTALKTQTKRTYYATVDDNTLEMTKTQVTELFESITNERELFDMFNTLLISKTLCHMVLNNYSILTRMKPLFHKFMPLYKYLFGYAWSSFYMEECIFKTKTTKDSRYVFDIRNANLLPVFPMCSDDINQNPYITFMVADKLADTANNCMALTMMEEHTGYGIDTLERFKWKFNVFTTGDPTRNIFDGLKWGSRYAISGSIIPAFVQIKSPLFDPVVDKNQPEHKQWSTYFSHFYPESDIDFMCNDESVFDFMDSINNVKELIEKNINKDRKDKNEVKITVEPIRSTTIVVGGQYFTENLAKIREEICKPNVTVEYILNNLDSLEIKGYFYGIYYENKKKNNKLQRIALRDRPTNSMYEDYFKMVSMDDIKIILSTYIEKDASVAKDSEICFYVNDFRDADNKVPKDKNMMLLKIGENIKFKLKSNHLLHSIEAFRVKSNDFFSVVGKFHLPCVRAYYNGDTVYMMPSCITANMTGINIDYKYFAGMRDPVEILNKYRMRGFGTLLNQNERQEMFKYTSNVMPWKKMLDLDFNKKDTMKNLFGFKDINNNLFKPAHFQKGYPLDSFNKITRKQIKSVEDLKKYYKTKYGYDCEKVGLDMFKFKTIGTDGTIIPLKKWVLNSCWDLLNNN